MPLKEVAQLFRYGPCSGPIVSEYIFPATKYSHIPICDVSTIMSELYIYLIVIPD